MRKKAKKKKNIKTILKSNLKLIIGIVTGITVISGVYAATILFAGDSVSYDNTTSGLTSTNVQDALDELYAQSASCMQSPFALGDYFTLIPDASTFTIASAITGYTSDQTITPNELTLWRVFDIHDDGSVDAVSEYVSSEIVCFEGIIGYANFIGGLQTIAAQYSKSGYTINTRMIGYNGQTSTIQNTSAFDGTSNTAPSEVTTPSPEIDIPTPITETGEEYSGGVLGDTLYLKDYLLVQNVYQQDDNTENYCPTGMCAYQVGTTKSQYYWFATRIYTRVNANAFRFGLRVGDTSGNLSYRDARTYNSTSGWRDSPACYTGVRPIITLKSGITILGGSGTKNNPYTFN